MNLSHFFFVCTAAAGLLTGTAQAEEGITDSAVLTGMVNAQSGPASAVGVGMLEGARTVFKDINGIGGVHGHPAHKKAR